MSSLLLNNNWDITLDSLGNLAITDKNYSIAQDVANAVKLFTNDAYFDTQAGIPHFDITLKRNPSPAVIRARLKETTENVLGVKSANVDLIEISDNTLRAEILITLEDDTTAQITSELNI